MLKNIKFLLKELKKEEQKSTLIIKVACLIFYKNETKILVKGHNEVVSNEFKEKIDFHDHAELNALKLLNLEIDKTKTLSAIITLMPCYNCIKLLNSKNIKEVFYYKDFDDKKDLFKFNISKKYAILNNIKIYKI